MKGLLYFHLIFTLMVLSFHRSKQKPEELSMYDPSTLADSKLHLSLTNTIRILKSLLSFSASKLFQQSELESTLMGKGSLNTMPSLPSSSAFQPEMTLKCC